MEKKLILKHHKDFHRVQFQELSVNQRNLVFALCCKVMNQKDNLLIFNISEMSSLSKLEKRKMSDKEMFDYLENLYNTLKKTSIKIKKDDGIKIFSLFTDYESFEHEGKFQIKVNDSFRYMLNDIKEPFTIQNLIEYTDLKSGYSQLLYSLLKEWDKKKELECTLDEFRNELGIPQGYDMDDINNRVLKPIMKELPLYFKSLKLEKIKTGRKITSLKFTWKNNPKAIQALEDNEVEISENLNKAIEKAKKNRFIEALLTEKNIVELIDIFTEDQLIKGLNHAYKEIKQEIKHLSYLIKTIETGAGKPSAKLKVVGESLAPKEIEVIEVAEILGEGKEDQVEVQEVKYTKDLESAKRFLFAKTTNIKIRNKMNIINNFKDLESAIDFGEKHGVDMSYFKAEEVIEEIPKEEAVKVKPKREMTQNQYDCLFEIYLSSIRLTLAKENKEIDVEEERKKFDLKNKDSITIIKVKEITREDLLKKFDELNFSYSLEELEEAFELIDVTHTNQELLNVINSTNRELLDSIVENMREFKAGF